MAPAIMLFLYLFSLSYGQNISFSSTVTILKPGNSTESPSESKLSVSSIWNQTLSPSSFPVHLSSSSSNLLPVFSYSAQFTSVKPGHTGVLNTEINQRNSTIRSLPNLSSKTPVTLQQSSVTPGQISLNISTHLNIKQTATQNNSSTLIVATISSTMTMFAAKQSMTMSFQPFNSSIVSFKSSLKTISPSSRIVTNKTISRSSHAVLIVKRNLTSSKAISQTFLKSSSLSTISRVQNKTMQPSEHLMTNSSSTVSSTPVKSTTRGSIISRTITHYNENVSTAVFHNTSKGNAGLSSTSVVVNPTSSETYQTSSSMIIFQPSSPKRKQNKTVIISMQPTTSEIVQNPTSSSEIKFSPTLSPNPINSTVSNIQKSISMSVHLTMKSSSTMQFQESISTPIRHPSSKAPSSEKSHTPLIVGLAVGLSLGVVLVIIIIVCYKRKRSSYQYNVFYDEQNIVMHPFDYSK